MIPTDCPAVSDKTSEDISKILRTKAIDAQDFLDKLSDRGPYIILFLLDCCRDHPRVKPDLATRGDGQSNTTPGGLAAMHKAGSLIAFACAPGAVVDDNSHLFAKHLVKHITTPKKDIINILIDVTRGVMDESNAKQMPFVNFQLIENVYLCEHRKGKSRIGE